MNDELKREFARLSHEPGPPTALTADALIAGGRRRRTRRTIARVSGATTAVAVVAVAAVLLSSGLPGGTGAPDERGQAARSKDTEATTYPLPDLDPDKQYQYLMYDEATDTDATGELSAALWEYLETETERVRVSVTEGDKTQTVEPADEQKPRFLRQREELLEIPCADDSCQLDPGAEPLLDRPTYQLMLKEGDNWGTDAQFVFDDRDFSETFNIGFYPAGSFIAEPYDTAKQPWFAGHLHDQYLVDGCSDLDYGAHGAQQQRRYDCDEATAPGGEKILTVERRMTQDDAPGYVAYRDTVVVRRADGSAIRVQLESPGFSSCNGCGDSAGDDPPSLDLDQLTELALALPQVGIE